MGPKQGGHETKFWTDGTKMGPNEWLNMVFFSILLFIQTELAKRKKRPNRSAFLI